MSPDRPKRLLFDVYVPGEISAGLRDHEERIIVEFGSGDPLGEPGEFAKEMTAFLREWYDTRGVVFLGDEEYFFLEKRKARLRRKLEKEKKKCRS